MKEKIANEKIHPPMLQALQDHMEEETSQRSNGSVGKVEYSVRVELGSDAATRRREPLIS